MRLDGIQRMPTPAGGSVSMRSHTSANTLGQVLVIVALGMVALVAAIGIVIDLGFAWAANRDTQNGSDAAAHAGAIVLVQSMAGTSPATDADVEDAVYAAADANGFTLEEAEYTGWLGNPLGYQIGDGFIPPDAQGVRTLGSRIHETLLARVVGINEISVNATATAVSGPQADPCPSSDDCALLPVAFPMTIVTCDGQSKSVSTTDPWVKDTLYVIPLCGANPGSVGWIDWAGSGGGGGLANEVCDPDPPALDLPGWYWVSETGRPSDAGVQACLEGWIGRIVLIPMFDGRCQDRPAGGQPCTQEPAGGDGWYYLPAFAAFHLEGVHVDGSAECDSDGSGATSCLVGTFVDAMGTGQVASLDGLPENLPSAMFAIQLIR